MPQEKKLPTTPSPEHGNAGKITDFFESVHQSESKQGKRELELDGGEEMQYTKKLKRNNGEKSDTIITPRSQVNVDIRVNQKPASSVLLDNTDDSHRENLVREPDAETASAEDDGPVKDNHSEPPAIAQTPVYTNRPRRKRPISSRLLDETDGGLADSLVDHYDTVPADEDIPKDDDTEERSAGWVQYPMGKPLDNGSAIETKLEDSEFKIFEDDTAGNASEDVASVEATEADDVLSDITPDDDGSETEALVTYHGEDDLSGDEGSSDEVYEDGTDAESQVDDSDQGDVVPKAPHNTPTLSPVPATPEQHNHISHTDGSADDSPVSGSSESTSSLDLPNSVVDKDE